MVREVGQCRVRSADFPLEAGAGYLKRAVGVARLEADDLAIGEATILRFELAIDQPM
jgi:hypothetical protein